eukprot:6504399-Pyramimonas_sp.AAC.1
MAALLKLWESASSIQDDYFLASQETAKWLLRELHASVTIQRIWRGFVVRNNLNTMTDCSIKLQAGIRGHMGRKRFGNHQ